MVEMKYRDGKSQLYLLAKRMLVLFS